MADRLTHTVGAPLSRADERSTKPVAARVRRRLRENLTGYAFLLPWLIGFFCLTLGPMAASLYLSFTNYDLLTSPLWIGLQNYVTLFTTDPRYLQSLKVTVTFVVTAVPLKLVFALLLAVLLNRGVKPLGLFRAIYYVPSLLGGSVAIAIMWRQIFGENGLINHLLLLFGITGPSWISDPRFALDALVALAVWQVGAPLIIFLAGLRQVPPSLYEAAMIDGAGRRSQFLRITLPLISPLIFFNLVMQIIGSFQAFNSAYIISNGTGGPVDATLFYTLYLYEQAFVQFHMGYAAAMAWVLLLVIAGASAVNFLSSRYWVYYQDAQDGG